MNAVAILALIEAGIRITGVIATSIEAAKGTLSQDQLAPLQKQLEQLHAQSLSISAQVDAAAAIAATKA